MIIFRKGIVLSLLFLAYSILAADTIPGTVVFWGYDIGGSGSLSSLKSLSIGGEVITNAVAIAAGDEHGLALRSDGTVVGFGFNGYGQTIGSSKSHSENADGVVNINGQVLSNVVAIAAGGNHSLALKSDGSVVGWGTHVVPTGLSNIAAIATGYNYSMGVTRDGTVLYLGGGDLASWRSYPDHHESDYASIFLGLGNSQIVEGLSNVVALAIASGEHAKSMALRCDSTLAEISVANSVMAPDVQSNVIAIAGGTPGLALKEDGTVVEWSGATGNVPSGLTNVIAIAGGHRHNLALKRDETVTMWGHYRFKELAVPPGLSNVVAIAAGFDFFLAITNTSPLLPISK
jgi:alpha-tubulin suppressor-like RCC1 family protein